MKLYVCTDHDGHYPVGVASIVVADNLNEATELLRAELVSVGLRPTSFRAGEPFTLQEVDLSKPAATVLLDGNY